MALGTLTKIDSGVEGNRRIRVYDVQLTSGANYTTGGETVTASSIGLRKIMQANVLSLATTSSGSTSRSVAVAYSGQDVKLIVQTTASAEAASNSDQSTFSVRIEFKGY